MVGNTCHVVLGCHHFLCHFKVYCWCCSSLWLFWFLKGPFCEGSPLEIEIRSASTNCFHHLKIPYPRFFVLTNPTLRIYVSVVRHTCCGSTLDVVSTFILLHSVSKLSHSHVQLKFVDMPTVLHQGAAHTHFPCP